MSRIKKLPTVLANQIAAGEVVERPASILKEILENSIDAKSSEIKISIEGGGIKKINLQDNGSGIDKDDLILACMQHATSKINSSEDLSKISSLGFRGEALASIKSVTKFLIASKVVNDEPYGWKLGHDNGKFVDVPEPFPMNKGTIIETRDLFYNLPARRKFLRTEKTEFNHLEEVFKKIALSTYNVSFEFVNNNKRIKKLPICKTVRDKEKRIATLCGKSFLENSLYLEKEHFSMKLSGWVVKEEGLKRQTDCQYFFVNNRIVKDKVISHAMRQAYDELCPQGMYPAYVLYLSINYNDVDVNVHPTKHEVRFKDARLVHSFIVETIKECLINITFNQIKQEVNLPSEIKEVPLKSYKPSLKVKNDTLQKDFLKKAVIVDNYKIPFEIKKEHVDLNNKINVKKNIKLLTVIGNVALVDIDKDIKCINVLKFYQKLSYEKLLKEWNDNNQIKMIPLLFPKTITVNKEPLEENLNKFAKLGFDISAISQKDIIVRQVPEFVISTMIEKVFLTVFLNIEKKSEEILKLMANVDIKLDYPFISKIIDKWNDDGILEKKYDESFIKILKEEMFF